MSDQQDDRQIEQLLKQILVVEQAQLVVLQQIEAKISSVPSTGLVRLAVQLGKQVKR